VNLKLFGEHFAEIFIVVNDQDATVGCHEAINPKYVTFYQTYQEVAVHHIACRVYVTIARNQEIITHR
jgi:hypothetical protein